MRYRNQVNIKLDILENNLRSLEQIVQRQQPVKEYLDTLERTVFKITHKLLLYLLK